MSAENNRQMTMVQQELEDRREMMRSPGVVVMRDNANHDDSPTSTSGNDGQDVPESSARDGGGGGGGAGAGVSTAGTPGGEGRNEGAVNGTGVVTESGDSGFSDGSTLVRRLSGTMGMTAAAAVAASSSTSLTSLMKDGGGHFQSSPSQRRREHMLLSDVIGGPSR